MAGVPEVDTVNAGLAVTSTVAVALAGDAPSDGSTIELLNCNEPGDPTIDVAAIDGRFDPGAMSSGPLKVQVTTAGVDNEHV